MTINGFNIKRYRAKVKERPFFTTRQFFISEDGYKIVEGYVSIANIILSYEDPSNTELIPIFVAEEPDLSSMGCSSFGATILPPMIYREGEFEIIEEL